MTVNIVCISLNNLPIMSKIHYKFIHYTLNIDDHVLLIHFSSYPDDEDKSPYVNTKSILSDIRTSNLRKFFNNSVTFVCSYYFSCFQKNTPSKDCQAADFFFSNNYCEK